MRFKNLLFVALIFIIGCHSEERFDSGKTEKIIAKSDSIEAKLEKSRNILDSVTNQAIEETSNKLEILNNTIDLYKNKKNVEIKKIVNVTDTVYFDPIKIQSFSEYSEGGGMGSEDNKIYSDKIKSLTEENNNLKEEIKNLKNKLSSVQEFSENYSKKSSLIVESVKKNSSGEEVKTKRARATESIKILYYPSKEENNGNDLYLCIIDPDNNHIGNEADTIITNDGKKLIFLEKFSIRVESPNIFYYYNNKFKSGIYLIEIYQNGSKIRNETITLTRGIL